MEEKIYRINSVGAYFIGHFNTYELKMELGCPNTCMSLSFSKTSNTLNKLLNELNVDWEDGGYINNLLKGQIIKVYFDQNGHACYISAPFEDSTKIIL